MMDCKKALTETGGDVEKAVDLLRKKGIAKAEKRAGRSVSQGLIYCYQHFTGKVGVLVEINCRPTSLLGLTTSRSSQKTSRCTWHLLRQSQ